MSDEITGQNLQSVVGIFKPKILSFTHPLPVNNYMEVLNCPFCGTHGQNNLKWEGRWVNHCPICGLTWEYKLDRR